MTTSQFGLMLLMVSRADSAFGPADVRGAVDDLALEVGEIHDVEIHDADFADAGGGEIHGDGRAEAAGADAQDAGGANFLLARQPDFGQNQVARIAADLVIVQSIISSTSENNQRRKQAGAKGR